MSDHKLVVKNTLMLYLRMFITLAISLFTTRIVFEALGLSDLGIYNIVGGVLSLLGILNGTLSSSSQRFISFDLGLQNSAKLKRTFSTLLSTHVLLAVLIFIIAETVGLWFVNNKLIIPADKMTAANWVYQAAIFGMVLGIIKSPFTAAIIAHEKMGIYAYFTIIDVVIKLLIVLCLLYFKDNRLIIYAFLLQLSTLIDFAITVVYSLRKFKECSLKLNYDKGTFREILSFSGWTLIGQTTIIANEQVVNIFINWFFGTVANGARDIAGRINGIVSQFVYQFQMALSPAITKDYSSGNIDSTKHLIIFGCKLSFLLMLVLCVPIIAETDMILKLWLGSAPQYTVWFTRLILINTLMDTMTGPVLKAIQATGKIKRMQIIVSSILVFIMPLSYVVLKMGFEPYTVYWVNILVSSCAFIARLYILQSLINLPISDIIKGAIAPCGAATALTLIIISIFKYLAADNMAINIILIFASVIITLGIIYIVALKSKERHIILSYVAKLIHKNSRQTEI